MKINWNGPGVKINDSIVLEWNHYDGASYYRLYSNARSPRHINDGENWRTILPIILQIRVIDWPLQ